MFQSLMHIGCGILVGIGLVLLAMARVSERCGDEFGAGFARITSVLFLLAGVVLYAA